MTAFIGRREFITLLGGAAAWPLTAHAQQPQRMRRVGALMAYAESDRQYQAYFAEFRGQLSEPGSVSQALERIRQLVPSHTRGRRSYGAGAAEVMGPSSSLGTDGGCPVTQVNDLSRSLAAFDPISTLVVVVEMSKASWLVRSVVPGVERQPLKKLEPDAAALLRLVERWRSEAVRAGRPTATETAQVHHAPRRRGGHAFTSLAVRGARTAERTDAAHWRADAICCGRSGGTGTEHGICADPPTVGLDSRTKRADRLSLAGG
jgi:hypothetical protein